MFCQKCGKEIMDEAVICVHCGCAVPGATIPGAKTMSREVSESDIAVCINTLFSRLQTAAALWIIVGVLQIIVGIFVLFVPFIGMFPLIFGCLNVMAGVNRLKTAPKFKSPYEGMVDEFEKSLGGYILLVILNVIFGGVIGVAGCIYEIVGVRNYVLNNRYVFEKAATMNDAQ